MCIEFVSKIGAKGKKNKRFLLNDEMKFKNKNEYVYTMKHGSDESFFSFKWQFVSMHHTDAIDIC